MALCVGWKGGGGGIRPFSEKVLHFVNLRNLRSFVSNKRPSCYCFVFSPLLLFFWNFEILLKIKRQLSINLFIVISGSDILKIFFFLFTILPKNYKIYVTFFSDGRQFSAAVPFAYPNVHRHFRLSPERNENLNCLTFWFWIFFSFCLFLS